MKDGKFEPLEPVLVRDGENLTWQVGLFSHYGDATLGPSHWVGGFAYRYCIPYEGNEYLLGTDNSPEQEGTFEFGEHIEMLSNDGITWLHAIYLRPELEEFGIHRVHIKDYSHSSNCHIKQIRKADW